MGKRESGLEKLLRLAVSMDTEPNGQVRLAEQVLRIRDREGRVRPLRANPAQLAFEARRGKQNIVLKARQMGMTSWIAGRFFLRTALRPETSTLLVAHTREAAETIFEVVRRMWEYLPEELREGELQLSRANAGALVFADTGSEFRVASAADANAGRGMSVQYLHCSEVSRWPGDAKATLAGLRAALAPCGELVLESTPSGAYGAFYEEWCAAVDWDRSKEVDGTEPEELIRHFFPWWMEAAYVGRDVAPEEQNDEERLLGERHGLSGAQLGFRRELERRYGALRSQEFAEDAETCFRATGACCFEVEVAERRMREVDGPVRRSRNGALLEWLPPVVGRRYVVAVDTAGGGEDGDFAAVQVVDVLTGMQCAELQEKLRPAALVEVCVHLAQAYGNALIAVERNNHGAAVLALLELRTGVQLYRQGGQLGWLTSSASKPEMVARLGTLLRLSPELFFSVRLLGESRTFVSDALGRAGAANGAHDDLVMAMAVAQSVRAELVGCG